MFNRCAEVEPPSELREPLDSPGPPEPKVIPNVTPNAASHFAPALDHAATTLSANAISGKVIGFPRSAAVPLFHAVELAEPVVERPRIVEAPEILPPPPALGGMLIEPERAEALAAESSTDALVSASIARRALAALIDGAILSAAVGAFGAIFLRVNPVRGPLPLLSAGLGVIALLLWAIYQLVFLVYTGSTPGLRAAGLQLTRFDGGAVPRRVRRFRALACLLSAMAAGLGYFWCFLDPDELCWHDRITRTLMQRGDPDHT